ncbi:MAG: MarR family transcriptional regulator [Oscillibacter sp.]|nr:MarR family transcriptional regulator [Oscillibacter sp.]MBR1690860.1 MarR family transcriptional regulator [Oscillibacter sp.]
MEERCYDALKLENQLCFPLYACSREIIKQYKPFLDELDLTYTQYITMMVLWERQSLSAKELGQILYLDSGTLTPLLKKLEGRGLVDRRRDPEDERSLLVTLTEAGAALRREAARVPEQMARCVPLTPEEAGTLYALLYKILNQGK